MEIWKDVIWYEWIYQVSNLWRIKSLERIKTFTRIRKWKEHFQTQKLNEKIMKQTINIDWYTTVKLQKNWISKEWRLSRIVYCSFNNIPIQFDWKMCVCHKDDNRLNNNLQNLFLWTQKDNVYDCIKKWRRHKFIVWPMKWKTWILNKKSKKIWQYDLQDNLIKIWDCSMDIMRELWLLQWNISMVCRWERKTTWWFKFKFI